LVENYRDLGVSAFRGKNADHGALKAFLDRVESGLIQPGSYLIVESLDRLSRTDITYALQLVSRHQV
jgi:DNA invertase Pin-like site-specific DNA recombinase